MTDKLREAAQQALDDDLLTGQAQHLIGALMSRGFLPTSLSSAEHTTLWDVVKRQLRCVNKEGARAALAQQDAQEVPQGYKLVPVEHLEQLSEMQDEDWPPQGESGAKLAEHWFDAFRRKQGLAKAMLNAAPTPPAQQPKARKASDSLKGMDASSARAAEFMRENMPNADEFARSAAACALFHVAKARVEQSSKSRELAHRLEQEDTIHQLRTMLHTSDTLRAKLVQERDELLSAAIAAEAALIYLGATVHADSLHAVIAKVRGAQ